jgi:hypothetical protein
MLDTTIQLENTTAALAGVTVSHLVDEAEARQRLGAMVGAGGPVAIDIETAPHAAHVEKLSSLTTAREVALGKLRRSRSSRRRPTRLRLWLPRGSSSRP